jgi:hypothetical protein
LDFIDFVGEPGLVRPAHEGIPKAPENAPERNTRERRHGTHKQAVDTDDTQSNDHRQAAAVCVSDQKK